MKIHSNDNSNNITVDDSNDITEPVNKTIDKFKNQSSIFLIQSKFANDKTFSFNEAFLFEVEKELRSLNPQQRLHF